jgi:hypothetical protein
MRYDTLAELFYGSSFHQAFNATLRVTAHKQALLIAAEHDAAAFLSAARLIGSSLGQSNLPGTLLRIFSTVGQLPPHYKMTRGV